MKDDLNDDKNPTLVFVYNADSGVFNLLADVAHKLFSPQTYACNLCAITHSSLGMKNEWRQYLDTLKVPMEFLHADELKTRYEIKDVSLPAVFLKQRESLKTLVDSKTINRCRAIGDLKKVIDKKLAETNTE